MGDVIKRMSPRHEAIVRWLHGNPEKSRRECADHFGVTLPWLSTLVNSDMFQAAIHDLNERINGEFVETIADKATYATELLLDETIRLARVGASEKFVSESRDALLDRFGYLPKHGPGAKPQGQVNVEGDAIFVTGDDLQAALQRKQDRDSGMKVINA